MLLRRISLWATLVAAGTGLGAAPAQAATTYTGQVSMGMTAATGYGYVDPQGETTDYWFSYGTTTDYGQSTKVGTLAGSAPATLVAAQMTKLQAGTTYHYRLLALPLTSSHQPDWAHGSAGQDETFTTTRGNLNLVSSRLAVKRGSAAVALRCASTLDCMANVRLQTKARAGRSVKTVSCAARRVTVSAAAQRTFHLRVSSACLSLLRAAAGHRISGTATARVPTGQGWTDQTVTLVG